MSEPQIIRNGESYDLDTREHMDNGVSVHMCPNDSREQIERCLRVLLGLRIDEEPNPTTSGIYYNILGLLDRQEAITELNCRMDYEDMRDYLQAQVDKLTDERDELQRERNLAIGRAGYMERYAAEELAKLLGENDTIEVYDDKIHGKRRLVTGTQRKLEKQIAEMQEAIDAMGNGQFYAIYLKACEERDHFKDLVQKSAERICVPHGEWERISQTREFRRMFCDCGYELGLDRHETLPYEHTLYCPMPYFCPECGARIVSKANAVTDE